MHIISFKIFNFKSYKHCIIREELSPGINIFVGYNGSGKTTLLQAIDCILCLNTKISRSDQTFNVLKKSNDYKTQLKKSSGNMNGMVEELSKNAPAGSEATIQAIKQAMAAANNAYETTQKSIKQAVDLAQNNFNAAANTAVKAARGKK
jgi:recombinational DNA repair ATPase RecF